MSKRTATRRRWLAHCSASLVTLGALLTMPLGAGAQAPQGALILIVGDSLSAEYGLRRGTGWVALLERRMASQGIKARVVNASISGETTAGGQARLAALLTQHRPTHVVLELGANDALRGLPLAMTESNLLDMSRRSRSAGAKVVVVGMQLPPNYGKAYGDQFAQLFAKVARAEKAALVPFFLKGVADIPNAEAMFQADRIHPREEAHPVMLDNVWAALKPLLT